MEQKLAAKRAFALMKASKAAYLTTIDTDGFPETRAMINLRNPAKCPGLADFFSNRKLDFTTYFTTNTSSLKVRRIRGNSKACVYYSKPDEWRGVMLAGNIELVEDAAIKKELWQSGWTMYYPGGVDDPDYAILRLRPSFMQGYHQLEQYHLNLEDD